MKNILNNTISTFNNSIAAAINYHSWHLECNYQEKDNSFETNLNPTIDEILQDAYLAADNAHSAMLSQNQEYSIK
jgi:hypothetical protein